MTDKLTDHLLSEEHITSGAYCWCRPEIINVEGSDDKIIVHKDDEKESDS